MGFDRAGDERFLRERAWRPSRRSSRRVFPAFSFDARDRARSTDWLSQRVEQSAGGRFGIEGGLQIVVWRGLRLGRVGGRPAPVGLGPIDLGLAFGLHAAGDQKPLDAVAVHFRPGAIGPSRREARLEVGSVNATELAVYPSMNEGAVDRVGLADGLFWRALLGEPEPGADRVVRLIRQPGLKFRRMGKSQQWKLAHHASKLKYEVNFGNQELSEGRQFLTACLP